MNSELLLAHFSRISEAPDAIPRLRSFILDLAVRGKLVEHDAKDEPALKLIERIGAQKSGQGVAGGVSKLTNLIANDDAPFRVPPNWIWIRLGDVCSKTGSGSTPRGGKSVYQRSGVPFLRSQNIYNDNLRLDDVAYITLQTHEKMSGTAVKAHDLLLNITGGSIGRCCLVSSGLGQANVSQHVAIIRAAFDGIQRYLHQLILSPYFQSFVLSEQTGAGRGGLPKNRMDRIPVALPPLAEQHRIVSRVDELMILCDRLENVRAEREVRRNRLVAASHHHLANGETAERGRDHARFFIDQLSCLTSRSDQITQLRQTILSMAVRGNLSNQDAENEPACELLARIEKTRLRLQAEKKISKPHHLSAIRDDEIVFPLPSGWQWTRLGKLCYQISDGPHFSPQYVSPEKGVPFLSTRNVRVERFDLTNLKYVSREDHKQFCQRVRPEQGDVLYTKGGTTGIARVNDLDFEFSVWVHLAVLKIAKEYVDPYYVALALNSPSCYEQSQRFTQGISNFDLGLTRMIKIVLPLPPLNEQHHIVAKVEELMCLCDRLETQLIAGQVESRKLLEAVISTSLNDEQAPEMALSVLHG